MNTALDNLFNLITGTSHWRNVQQDAIQKIQNKYPYFNAAVLLSSITQHPNNTLEHLPYTRFTNTQWMSFLLDQLHPTYNQSSPSNQTADFKPLLNKVVEEEIASFTHAEANLQSVEINLEPSTEKTAEIEAEKTPESVEKLVGEDAQETLENDFLQDEEADLGNDENLKHISTLLQEQAAAFKKPVEEKELVVPVEPYHTIDYFESQGIKADLDAPKDKFTKQLRSFTDWLRQLKLQNPAPEDLGTDPELELAIQDIANHSNEAKEIVTEAMAEVLEKQGKLDKAIQLYIKLSFLIPDKSAYFAAKIQQIKGI